MKVKDELKSMFTEHWKYLAVNAACELLLFDKIFQGQNSLEKLIEINKWDYKTLFNLLDFLSRNDYLTKLDNTVYSLTEKGNLLQKDNPEGLYYACQNWSGEHLIAWKNLSYSIKTGNSSFEMMYGKPYFDYLNEHTDKLEDYHRAMFEYAKEDYKSLPDLIDFGKHKSVMDVGGGFGAAIEIIKEKYPTLTCLLFDLENVVRLVSNEKIEKRSGDFFKEIPNGSEAFILSRVLHDWNNEKAKQIIQNCYSALPPNGTLYLIENCTDKIAVNLSLLSLNMTAMCQSFERSSFEYRELFNESGFSFQSEKQLNLLQTIIIFKK